MNSPTENKKLVMTLRYERGPEKCIPSITTFFISKLAKIYTLVNIYMLTLRPPPLFEGLIRWGKVPDTAIGGGSIK